MATTVSFGGVPATNVNVSGASMLTCNTPPGNGTVDVVVTTDGGTFTLTGAFAYVPAPTLTDVAPTTGPEAGGTTVTIHGTGFQP
jgi:hypothetical protein